MPFSLRIAIADHDHTKREMLQQALVELGHVVVSVAVDGPSLVSQCETMQPDVIIAGILKAPGNGPAPLAIIYSRRPLPILLYSSDFEPESLTSSRMYVFMHLVTPIHEEHLQSALKECYCSKLHQCREDDQDEVLVGPASTLLGDASIRRSSPPPHPTVPR